MGVGSDFRGAGAGGNGRGFIKAPDGLHVDPLRPGAEQGGYKEHIDTGHKKAAQDGLDNAGLFDPDHIQPAEQNQNQHGQKHLTGIDFKAGDAVVKTEFQAVGGPVQTVHDQTDCGAVHGDICQVGHDQEPAAEESHPFSEAVFGKGEFPAGRRVFRHHVGVGKRNDDHDQRAEHHGDRRSGHAGVGQEFLTGIDEGTPADDTTEGNRPDMHGRELSPKVVVFHGFLLYTS